MRFLVRLLVNAAALWVATRIVPGVSYSGGVVPLLGVALVFGVVNAVIGPVAKILTFPIIILTLGIFALVINGLMLMLTSALSSALGLGFHVERLLGGVLGRAGREPREHDPLAVHPRFAARERLNHDSRRRGARDRRSRRNSRPADATRAPVPTSCDRCTTHRSCA